MILIQQKYSPISSKRSKELDVCLSINRQSGLFSNILSITQKNDQKMTFQDLFEVSDDYSNEIVVVANTDIYYDNSIKLIENIIKRNMIIALSRWNGRSHPSMEGTVSKKSASLYSHSQDTWVFVANSLSHFYKNFILGVPSCENRLLYEAYCSGVQIINPALDIRSYHHHACLNYNYPNRYIGPLLFPKLTNINYSTEALIEIHGSRYLVNTDTNQLRKLTQHNTQK